MGNVQQWVRDVNSWTDLYFKDYLEEVLRRTSLAILTVTVRKTPVWEPRDTDPAGYSKEAGGRARGGWQISLGTADAVPVNEHQGERQAEREAIQRAQNVLLGHSGFESIWITNPVEYITVLEFGGYPNPPERGTGRTFAGYSTQAPSGMLRSAIKQVSAQIPSIARAAAREFLGT